jgi:hypothetical protein
MGPATSVRLWCMGASELAEAIRSRQVSSREVVEAHLRRIEEVNLAINAVTVVLAEEAMQAADAADQVAAHGTDLRRLHGVPFTIKANIDLAGSPTTAGLKALAGAYPAQDAPAVARMRVAGAIPLGRTKSIDAAAKALLDMLNTPEIRATWDVMASMLPADTRRFFAAFYAEAGDTDSVATIQSFMTRQSLLRAWGEFQESPSPDPGARLHRRPVQGRHRPGRRSGRRNHPRHADDLRRQQPRAARGGAARRRRGGSAPGRAADRRAIPRGPVSGRRRSDRGEARHHHPDRPR